VTSRDLWSHGTGRQLPDLVSSALLALLLRTDDPRPAYFCSPWMTQFSVASNAFDNFVPLFPDISGRHEILFATYLVRLARDRVVRLVTTDKPPSREFLATSGLRSAVEIRVVEDGFHEKGILAPGFYLEGSMNLTHNGVYVNGEKVTYHVGGDPEGDERLARAYLEFNRRWETLDRHG